MTHAKTPHDFAPSRFWADERGAVTTDWLVLTAMIAGLGLATISMIKLPGIGLPGAPSGDTSAGMSQAAPDIVMADRRLPRTPDHPTLWANPFHAAALPEGFPDIGGQEFSITGDGNPRLLVARADPRVIAGATNPQFNPENYASSGTAFGTGQFHRILIDTPPPNTTYTVTLSVGGQTIQYRFTNTPY
ncbi:MAG: hypothetical protein ACXIU7_08265 [Roseinatronobacter sp.]